MNNTIIISTRPYNPCDLAGELIKNYNLKLHIISVFVILFLSLLGSSIPVASTRVKWLYINPIIINTGKFFGTGYVEI
jgi:hypothetical protein